MAFAAYIQGPAFWAPHLPDWDAACAAFSSGEIPEPAGKRAPRPLLLEAGDRRRAPETVALALEAGRMAIEAADRRGDELLSVFASAHGDLAIIDYMCSTLAQTPTQVSPTRFLNSIHNAPAGLWSMAVHCMEASTAVAAGECSFAAGLLEALMQCEAEQRGVLFVACDPAATGPLTQTIGSRMPVAFALILTPRPAAGTVASLSWAVDNRGMPPSAARSELAQSLAATGLACGAAFMEMLALQRTGTCHLNLSGGQGLSLQLSGPPVDGDGVVPAAGRSDSDFINASRRSRNS